MNDKSSIANTVSGYVTSGGTVALAAISNTQEHITWAIAILGALGLLMVSLYNVMNLRAQKEAAREHARRERLAGDLLQLQIDQQRRQS